MMLPCAPLQGGLEHTCFRTCLRHAKLQSCRLTDKCTVRNLYQCSNDITYHKFALSCLPSLFRWPIDMVNPYADPQPTPGAIWQSYVCMLPSCDHLQLRLSCQQDRRPVFTEHWQSAFKGVVGASGEAQAADWAGCVKSILITPACSASHSLGLAISLGMHFLLSLSLPLTKQQFHLTLLFTHCVQTFSCKPR